MKISKQSKTILINFLFLLVILAVILVPTVVFAQHPHQNLSEQLNNNQFIKNAWKYVLASLNAVVVLGLIMVALANILRINIEAYHVKRMLPAIILGVILANFSYLICRVMVDGAQLAADFFLSGITATDILRCFGLEGIARDPQSGLDTFLNVFVVLSGTMSLVGILLLFIFILILIMPPVLLMLFLGFLMAVRIYLIWFLVIMSPIAFFSLFFSPMGKIWQMWWSWWIKWLLMAPLAFLMIQLSVQVSRTPWPQNTGGGFAKWAFGVMLFALAIYVPYVVGGKIVSVWSNLWNRTAGLGYKGLRYAGVGIGGGMYAWGERRGNDRFGRFLRWTGNALQRASYYEDMKKELQKLPGGYATALGLESKEGRWKRELSHGFIAKAVGGSDIQGANEAAATELYDKFKTVDAIEGHLKKQGGDFNDIILSEGEIRKKYSGQALSFMIGAKRSVEGRLKEGSFAIAFEDAYRNKYQANIHDSFQGEDIANNDTLTDIQKKSLLRARGLNPDEVMQRAEVKKNFLMAFGRTRNEVTPPIGHQVAPSPAIPSTQSPPPSTQPGHGASGRGIQAPLPSHPAPIQINPPAPIQINPAHVQVLANASNIDQLDSLDAEIKKHIVENPEQYKKNIEILLTPDIQAGGFQEDAAREKLNRAFRNIHGIQAAHEFDVDIRPDVNLHLRRANQLAAEQNVDINQILKKQDRQLKQALSHAASGRIDAARDIVVNMGIDPEFVNITDPEIIQDKIRRHIRASRLILENSSGISNPTQIRNVVRQKFINQRQAQLKAQSPISPPPPSPSPPPSSPPPPSPSPPPPSPSPPPSSPPPPSPSPPPSSPPPPSPPPQT